MPYLYFFLVLLLLLGIRLLIWGFLIEPKQLIQKVYRVYHPQIDPRWLDQKIIFFSDLHIGKHFDAKLVKKLVEAISAQKPDLILFGGDLVEEKTKVEQIDFYQEIFDLLASLEAPLGKFAIWGNHDAEAQLNQQFFKEAMKRSGFQILANEAVEIEGLNLIGLKESYHQEVRMPSHSSDNFSLILMHQPDYLEEASLFPKSPSLCLSGHSHNGQISFFGKAIYTVRQGRKYPYGHYKIGERHQQITSSGLGTVHIHARLFVVPEFITIRLSQRKPASSD